MLFRSDLTPEGRLLYEKGRKLASEARNLQDSLMEHSEYLNRSLYLGGDALTCSYALPWKLAAFRRLNPDVSFSYRHLDQDTLIEALFNGELDIALVGYASRHKKLESRECLKDEVVLVAAPSLNLRKKITFHDLKKVPLIWFNGDRGLELTVNQGLNAADIAPKDMNLVMEISDLVFMKNLILTGMGASFLPMQTVIDELNYCQLEVIEVEGLAINLTTHLLTKKDQKLRKVVSDFIAFASAYDVKQVMAERFKKNT